METKECRECKNRKMRERYERIKDDPEYQRKKKLASKKYKEEHREENIPKLKKVFDGSQSRQKTTSWATTRCRPGLLRLLRAEHRAFLAPTH